jgi:hypothetical protein
VANKSGGCKCWIAHSKQAAVCVIISVKSMRAASVTPSKAKAADAVVDTADDLDFVPPSLQKMRDLSSALKSQIEVQGTPPAAVAGGAKKAPVASKQSGGLARKGAGKAEEHSEMNASAGDSLPALEMQIKVESLQSNIEKMQLDAKKKQDSYLRREAQYKGQIERMKQVRRRYGRGARYLLAAESIASIESFTPFNTVHASSSILTGCVVLVAGKGCVVPNKPRFRNGQREAGASKDPGANSEQPGQDDADIGGAREGAR